MSKEMSVLEHIDELRSRLVKILISIGLISVFCFTFGFKEFFFQGTRIFLPIPDPFDNLASQAIKRIEEDLLPDFVRVIVTSPSQALIAELYFSVFLGIILSMPVIVLEFSAFFGPALYNSEKKRILKMALPATLLFIGGAVFSYILITPFTIDFLYRYGFAIVEETFITIDDFISFVLLFTIAFGLSFELPVLMWIITASGVVDVRFWKNNISYVIIILAFYGAIITPDGSGITMWFVAGPMIILYISAYFLMKWKNV